MNPLIPFLIREAVTNVVREVTQREPGAHPDEIADRAADRAVERVVEDPRIPEAAAPKPWWQSRGVWGAGAGIIASLAGLAGIALDEQDRALLVDAAVLASTLAGSVLALWGRIAAKRPIGG